MRRVQNEWAQGGRRERLKSLLAAARGRPGGPKNHVAPPGGLLGRKVDRFQPPGGEPGAPRSLPESLPESILEASFLGTPPGTNIL